MIFQVLSSNLVSANATLNLFVFFFFLFCLKVELPTNSLLMVATCAECQLLVEVQRTIFLVTVSAPGAHNTDQRSGCV